MIVSIDGIIGVGKSSILEALKANGESVFLEPFEKNPVLELFYTDIPRYSALVQSVFFPLRVDMQMSIPFRGLHYIERSCYSDRYTFGQMLQSVMKPEEWQGYTIFFDLFASKFNLLPDLTLIIDEAPDVCLQRIKERGREMEKGITIEYLSSLRDMYYNNRNKLGKEVVWLDGHLFKDMNDRLVKIQEIVKERMS